jgi:hypothetical protein
VRTAPGKSFDADQEQRRCPRQRVSWLVTVAAGNRSIQGLTRDVSASGAKILVKDRPALGVEIGLSLRPPGRRPVSTRALVWRLDPDGLACMFVGTQEADFLAAVTPRVAAQARPAVAPAVPAAPTGSAVLAPPAVPPPPALLPPAPVAAIAAAEIARTPVPPAARPAVIPAGPPLPAPAPLEPGSAVLVAVADPSIRAMVLGTMERNGHPVLDAGPQPLLALRMAEQNAPGIGLVVVAADLKLMNGDPLDLRLVPILPTAKVIVMSSRTVPRPAGAPGHWLPTPCSDAELMTVVRQALGA